MTDTAARIEVLRDALRAAATGDQALIERVYTEDVSGWSPVLDVTSRDDLATDLRGREAAFSDLDLTLDPIDAVGDKLIAEWRVGATHSGPLVLDELELEPTGRRIEPRGVFIAEFEGDRIRAVASTGTRPSCSTGSGCSPATRPPPGRPAGGPGGAAPTGRRRARPRPRPGGRTGTATPAGSGPPPATRTGWRPGPPGARSRG